MLLEPRLCIPFGNKAGITSHGAVQASSSTIAATVDALSERLDLGKVFRKAPTAAAYTLRGIICYFSHHYQVGDLIPVSHNMSMKHGAELEASVSNCTARPRSGTVVSPVA